MKPIEPKEPRLCTNTWKDHLIGWGCLALFILSLPVLIPILLCMKPGFEEEND